MQKNYPQSLSLVLKHEGGYVNHPKDPGGATNRGVTQGTYDTHRTQRGLPQQTVRLITTAEVEAIYRDGYWDTVKGDALPAGVDFAVFDFAVNSGPVRAIRHLQAVLGLQMDGALGPKTLATLAASDPAAIVRKLCAMRLSYLKALKTWPTFGKGWERRVKAVEQEALRMTLEPRTDSQKPAATTLPKVTSSPPVSLPEAPGGLFGWLDPYISSSQGKIMDINIVNGVIRAVAPALVAYLVGKGVIPASDYGGLIAAVTTLVAAVWSVTSKTKPAAA